MSQSKRVLVIDDEPDIRELLAITLNRMGLEVTTASNLAQAYAQLEDDEYELCLTDMRLPDGDGIDLVKRTSKSHPALPIIVITAHGSMDLAVESMKAGAFDFVNKPIDIKAFRALVLQALASPKETVTEEQADIASDIIGQSEAIQSLKEKIKKLSRSQAPVYIQGESGTGKELVARAIHDGSARKSLDFVAVNCGAIPSELMESEFFGHKKGSFTGAVSDKRGLFHAANGGTLFLDEVADLPIDMQVKLLRVIQEKAIRQVGGQKEESVDVRIISATHKDLRSLVEQGAFRQDLFYRLNVIELNVPPLRDRDGDANLLIDHFIKRSNDEGEELAISRDARSALAAYSFPGNIRELENLIERASVMCERNEIQLNDLRLGSSAVASSAKPTNRLESDRHDELDIFQQLENHSLRTILNGVSLDEYLERLERLLIDKAVNESRWNKTTSAKKLGITFRSIRYRMKKLGFDDIDENMEN